MKQITPFLILFSACSVYSMAQQNNTFRQQYDAFKNQKQREYEDFRRKANREYAEFMRKAWVWYQAEPGLPLPVHKDPPIPAPAPPVLNKEQSLPEKIIPFETVITAPPVIEQPRPIAPIPDVPEEEGVFHFTAYGTDMQVRLTPEKRFTLKSVLEKDVARQWEQLSGDAYNNLIRDCLTLRIRYNLCDWAYLYTLEQLTAAFLGKGTSEAALLQAFLFHQSGYKVRLGRSQTSRLYLLVASRHTIYEMSHFKINGEKFYPLHYQEDGLYIYDNAFPREQQLSLEVGKEQLFAEKLTSPRILHSSGEDSLSVSLSFNQNLIDFYRNYPQSHINNDGSTKWRFYAGTPLSHTVKNKLYPALKAALAGKSERQAANILINFVQTALTYGYDDEIWGGDHPFFSDETLYYPYSDCEDRAILFSRLLRDLLHLDTVLLYYPQHLAMAACFHEEGGGHTLLIDGKKFTYCEPTCSGFAPVGWCPEELKLIQPTVVKY